MCRAVKVLCVAPDRETLVALKLAAVGAEWELMPGATDREAALAQLESESPHVLVVWGDLPGLLAAVRERVPAMRIITGEESPEATVVVSTMDEVRPAITGLPRPGGPVRI